LQGWEPRQFTEFVFAPVWWQPWSWFRPAGSVTSVEAEFDDEQRDLFVALTMFDADRGTHGHSLTKATSPGADPNEYSSALRYVGHGPFTDYAEKAKLDRADEYRAGFAKDAVVNTNGQFYTVEELGG
jgi:hypothetical protein